jgi:DNA-binding CsgD family transcriptional regulator
VLLSGREDSSAELELILSRCIAEGTGQVILLEGPPTSGKTTILTTAARRAVKAGALAFNVSCAPAERELPFGVLNQIFLGAQLTADVRDRGNRVISEALNMQSAEHGDSGSAGRQLALAYHEISVILVQLASNSPVVIVVDNVSHADEQSKSCLLYLMRRIEPVRMLIVLADEVASWEPSAHFYDELIRNPVLHRVSLSPLTHGQVAHVLAERLAGPGSGDELISVLYAASGGNLGLLNSLIDDHLAGGQVRMEGYGHAIKRCLHRCEPAVVRVAQALAVLDRHSVTADQAGPVGLAGLAGLAGVDAETSIHALRVLRDAGITDGEGFRHPIGRKAVLATLTAPARQTMHRQAAKLLQQQGSAAPQVAYHLVEADCADVPWALPVLREAADMALLSQQAPLAARYLQLARQARATAAECASIRLAQMHAEWQVNPPAAGSHLASLTTDGAAGNLTSAEMARLLRSLLWNGRRADGRSVLGYLHRSAAAARSAADASEGSEVEAWLALCYPPLAQRRRPSVPAPAELSPIASPSADRWLSAAAYFSGVLTRGQAGQATPSAVQMLQEAGLRGETCWEEEAVMLALLVMLQADQAQTVLDGCDDLLARLPAQQAAPFWGAVLNSARAEAALRLGDNAAAEQAAKLALSLMAPNTWGTAVGLPLGSLILAATRTGNFDETDRRLAHAIPDDMYASRYALPYLHARGRHQLAVGNWYAALTDFLRCGELARDWGLDLAELVPWRTSVAEAWLLLGNHDKARQLVQEQLGRQAARTPRNRGLSLRVLAGASSSERRPHLLGEALELFEECGDRYEQALTLRDLGTAYSELGQSRRARMQLRRARYLAEACAAGPLCEELLAMPDADGAVPTSSTQNPPGQLTNSEWRVALLAAHGYTNREIGAKLYVTPSTVEQHLTRVYRKLKIRHRKELSAVLSPVAPSSHAGVFHSPAGMASPAAAARRRRAVRR